MTVPADRAADPPRATDVGGADFAQVAARLTMERLPDLDESAMRLGFALVRLGSAHTQRSEQQVHRRLGISWSGFRVLYIIWLFERLEARDVARLSGVSRQTTSTVLATLERGGLIVRERVSDEDRRLVSIRLTAAGAETVREACREQNAFDVGLFATLGTHEKQALLAALDLIQAQLSVPHS